MANEPHDPKLPKPNRPALYRNKAPSEGGTTGSEVKGKSGFQGLSDKKVKHRNASVSFTDKASAKAQDIVLSKLPTSTTGSLAEISHSTAPIKKISGTPADIIPNPIKDIKTPDLPVGASLNEVIQNLGDLAKITPSMARTRPVFGKHRGIKSDGLLTGTEYDTSVQKSHAFKMRYRIPAKLANLANNDPDKLKKLGDHVVEQVFLEENERAQWISRLIAYRQSWQDFIDAGLDPAFDGAHNVHIPHTFSAIKAMHSPHISSGHGH
jgi:hypothetical protein